MVSRSRGKFWLVSLVGAGLLPGGAGAQGVAEPFFEDPERLGVAYALEAMAIRVDALLESEITGDTPAPEEQVGTSLLLTVEGIREHFLLVAGTFEVHDPESVQELEARLEELAPRTAARGTAIPVPDSLVGELARELRDVRHLLLPDGKGEALPYLGGVVALLLLADGGVAESFEEAAQGDAAARAVGRAALRRVEVIWEGLRPLAGNGARQEIDAMLQVLRDLYEELRPPHPYPGDPEDAEGPAVRLVGFLEEVVGALLHPDRELPRLLATIEALSEAGCEALSRDEVRKGRQWVALARLYHREYLQRTLEVLAFEADAELRLSFEALLASHASGEADTTSADACRALPGAFREAGRGMGG